jgi:excisionase family DNA binding protein
MTDCATLSVAEAARVLGIGRIAMYRAVKEGRVAVLRVGRKPRLRIPKVAIQELLRHPERWDKGGEE